MVGGRWSKVGDPVLYTSSSPELAMNEIMAHLDNVPYELLPKLNLVTISYKQCRPRVYRAADLPDGWNAPNYDDPASWALMPSTHTHPQTILHNWLHRPRSLAVAVPSVIMPKTFNYLFHGRHPNFAKLEVVGIEPLIIDRRLWKRGTLVS